MERPNIAAKHLEYLTSKNTEVDYEFAQPPIPADQIKFYPGSIKGPRPDDDPEAYSRWFYEHQPDALKENGQINIDEMGIKKKLISGEKNEKYTNEIKDEMEYFYEADEIGNWVFVMEIFAIICVPMNIAILYFTVEVFSSKTADGKNFYKVNNYWAKFLLSNDPLFRTPVAIILLAVAVKHGILVVKILIAAFIPDVPAGVEERESKREKIKEQAELDIQDFKHRNNAQSFEDIKREYAREQQESDRHLRMTLNRLQQEHIKVNQGHVAL